MADDTSEIRIQAIMATTEGYAIFLSDRKKTFVIHVSDEMGEIISMAINQNPKPRPLTHDLILNMFQGLEIEFSHAIITEARDNAFFARIILCMQNEVAQKITELDARPSDAIALALLAKKPIYATQNVLENTQDVTELAEQLIRKNLKKKQNPNQDSKN